MRLNDSSLDVLSPIFDQIEKEVVRMAICFLLTHIPDPRMKKRIDVCKDVAKTYVVCSRRKSQDVWEPQEDVKHVIFDIDLPSAKHLLKRYVVSQNFQKKALNKLEELKPNVIYAEGLDTLLIVNKYKKTHKVKVIYEVADLRESYIEKPKGIVARLMTDIMIHKEKSIFKIVNYLVVTSPKFYDVHYKKLITEDKVLFIPNAPKLAAFKTYKKKTGGDFTVGFIGGIRYLSQMKMLVDAAQQVGCKVIFAGAGGTSSDYEEIKKYCAGKNNVQFTGKYDYNTQIADIYGKVDCVYAVYDADNPNVRIALPNKLYEAIICELPIIVAKNTYLSELVEDWGVGISVSHINKVDLITGLTKLMKDTDYYQCIIHNCAEHKIEDKPSMIREIL